MNEPATIQVTLESGRTVSCPAQTRVGDLLPAPADPATGLAYLGALVNNDLVTFDDVLDIDSTVRFVTVRDPAGLKIYRRSLCFLLAKAAKDLHPGASFSIEHAMGPSLYCEFAENGVRSISPDGHAASPETWFAEPRLPSALYSFASLRPDLFPAH